jgi:hypothetical protein
MKTFRQNLNIWLEQKKSETTSQESIELLEEIQRHIKSKESDEEHMVNTSYSNGYYDKEFNKGHKSGYYKQTYKTHDFLKRILNNN